MSRSTNSRNFGLGLLQRASELGIHGLSGPASRPGGYWPWRVRRTGFCVQAVEARLGDRLPERIIRRADHALANVGVGMLAVFPVGEELAPSFLRDQLGSLTFPAACTRTKPIILARRAV